MKTLLFLAVILFTPHVQAGGMDGGGGQGILCTSPQGKRSLESLDLFEARNVWGYDIPASQDLRGEFRRMMPNIFLYNGYSPPEKVGPPPPPSEEDVFHFETQFTKFFLPRMRPIPSGTRLRLSNDTGGRVIDPAPNCRMVQVMYYVDENVDGGQMLVDREYWDLLSPQEQIAFFFHENIYKELRFFGEKTSVRARKIVGMLFAQKEFPGIYRQIYNEKNPLFCYANAADTEVSIAFFVLPDQDSAGKPRSRLVFTSIYDRYSDRRLLVETTANAWWKYEDWASWKFSSVNHEILANSSLGSTHMLLQYPDKSKNECGGNKKCAPIIKFLNKDGKWVGGPIICRNYRDKL